MTNRNFWSAAGLACLGALAACVPGEIDPDGGAGGGQACGSRGLPGCDRGEFCNFPISSACGEADKPGTCEEPPGACTREYAPVCGCDGKTYGNACTAAAASVSVRSLGECESADGGTGEDGGVGQSCGGLAGVACPDGQYCNFPPEALCGAADQTGTCAVKPEACTLQYDPVCGCDDKTYGNACAAAAAGVSIQSEGECADAGQFCGGLAGVACPDGQYCNFPPEAQCGAADQGGTCAVRPENCTFEYVPVCGCDDRTYGNACAAAAAGVSVQSEGECVGVGAFCGGLAGAACPDGHYCNYAPEALCGAADQGGTCALKPEVCTQQYDPVCGCDDKTYGNACTAASAGVSVVHDGPC